MSGWARLGWLLTAIYFLLALAMAFTEGGFVVFVVAALIYVIVAGVIWVIRGFARGF